MQLVTEREKTYSTLVEMLRTQAEQHGDKIAFTHLLDGEQMEQNITYAELDLRAKQVAAALQAIGGRGDRALLLYPTSLDYVVAFFGCLYAGVIAVPAYPPHPKKPMDRIASILENAKPSLILTSADIQDKLQMRTNEHALFASVKWVATDVQGFADGLEWREPEIDGDTMAFLQYTSGSTSTPKGVMLSHGNLLHNLQCIQEGFGFRPGMTMVFWLPPFHDMGLIGGILTPLYTRGHCILMAPFDFLQKPLRWMEAVSRYKAHLTGGPNFAYDLCVNKIKPEQVEQLDLSNLEVAFNGAEPIQAETLRRFAEHFAPAGYRPEAMLPCYGLAESSLLVSNKPLGTAPAVRKFDAEALKQDRAIPVEASSENGRALVSCGRSSRHQTVLIVNGATSEVCLEGQVGEIWTQSGSVAHGYWGNEEATQNTFGASVSGSGQGVFMRTGDLGFMLDGELFVTGRNKDMIVIKGRNYYPQDIELTVEQSVEAVRLGCSAAFSAEIDGQERLIVVAELDRAFRPRSSGEEVEKELKGIAMAIRRVVTEMHDVQLFDVVLLKYGTIPKTSSGKIQRHASRNGYLNKTLDAWGV